MRGKAACEAGDRTTFTPTTFLTPLNGPNGAFERPCSDGSTAFGQTAACGGHVVQYTTVVMKDVSADTTFQDEFVSEASARLGGAGATGNLTVGLTDLDATGYFYNGLFKNHLGALRSEKAVGLILAALAN